MASTWIQTIEGTPKEDRMVEILDFDLPISKFFELQHDDDAGRIFC